MASTQILTRARNKTLRPIFRPQNDSMYDAECDAPDGYFSGDLARDNYSGLRMSDGSYTTRSNWDWGAAETSEVGQQPLPSFENIEIAPSYEELASYTTKTPLESFTTGWISSTEPLPTPAVCMEPAIEPAEERWPDLDSSNTQDEFAYQSDIHSLVGAGEVEALEDGTEDVEEEGPENQQGKNEGTFEEDLNRLAGDMAGLSTAEETLEEEFDRLVSEMEDLSPSEVWPWRKPGWTKPEVAQKFIHESEQINRTKKSIQNKAPTTLPTKEPKLKSNQDPQKHATPTSRPPKPAHEGSFNDDIYLENAYDEASRGNELDLYTRPRKNKASKRAAKEPLYKDRGTWACPICGKTKSTRNGVAIHQEKSKHY